MTDTVATPPEIPGARRYRKEARGVDFHVTENGPVDGAPVICLHGWPQHHWAYRDLLEHPPEGMRIIVPDLPGYGWSGPPPHDWEKEEVASDILALMDALAIERAVLVAHDWGAWIGFLMVLRAPERFTAYLPLNMVHLWNSPARLLPHVWRLLTYQPAIAFLGVPIQRHTNLVYRAFRSYLHDRSRMTREQTRVFTDRFRDPGVASTGSQTYRTFLTREVPAGIRDPERRRLTVPTRMLFGVHDHALHRSLAAAETANADDYEVEYVPDAGHFIVDEKPELVRDRLISLVAEFPPR